MIGTNGLYIRSYISNMLLLCRLLCAFQKDLFTRRMGRIPVLDISNNGIHTDLSNISLYVDRPHEKQNDWNGAQKPVWNI